MSAVTGHTERLSAAVSALEAINLMVDAAVNHKILKGRLPPLGKLLSEIQHTAQTALEDARTDEQQVLA